MHYQDCYIIVLALCRVSYQTGLFSMPCLHYLHSYVSIITHLVGISNFCTQILMNARQHKLGTANIGVEIHWAHTNAIAMKGIH